ncbi:cytochrome P450 [Thalassorhabdomicrobium marinisediminis]|uniref:Cytochrome P450 n=1 Tax=Thalassorhabdomicrobium marinisediminis TaxID=2170577 RepID=A0A2T7FZG0_9RHOB|nr:cytochrome P450 [Thalassorhabdomicrobium marinisediminis]PVA07528.1 cytochrome P450 [Thalassorhabdomicrobium marinisediminis]
MTRPDFDPLSARFAQDPHAVYAELRALDAPYYYEDVDTWMLTKAAEVEAVALNKTMVRNRDHLLSEAERKAEQRKLNWHDMPHHERFVQTNLLESEGETHARLRKLVFREFTAAMIARQRDTIQAFVDHLLDGLADRDTFDFVEDFAAHVPGHIIGRVIGVPDVDCPQLRVWSEQVVRFFDVGRGEADKQLAEQATKEFYEYLLTLVAARRKAPREDLMSRMVEHCDAGRMSEDELVATTMLILMAGHGSTIDVLGSGMHALLRFPDQHQKLRDDPTLINLAVQEMFRFESPLPYFHRFATEDTEVAGRMFEAGTRFGLLYGAANRDPARFEKADQFDVTRSPNRHLAFGGGTHFCLGNHLARLDMDVIFTTLNQRFPRIELVQEPTYKPGLSVRGPIALEIAVRRP